MAAEKIFISYRRSPGLSDESESRFLGARLMAIFGPDAVFRDIDSADALIGRDFKAVLKQQLDECTACLVVIGPKWIDDLPRLQDPNDPVRLEISWALAREDVRVVPITVGGAQYPSLQDLPDDLTPLIDRGGLTLTNNNANEVVDKLESALRSDDIFIPAPAKPARTGWRTAVPVALIVLGGLGVLAQWQSDLICSSTGMTAWPCHGQQSVVDALDRFDKAYAAFQEIAN